MYNISGTCLKDQIYTQTNPPLPLRMTNWRRSMYNISGTYLKDQGLPNRSPWAHDVTGRYFGWLCFQAAGEPGFQGPLE